jgi:two-component system, NarL family, nitrate/nitrite response regulator NarL
VTHPATWIAIDQHLESLSAIQELIDHPGPEWHVAVCGHASMVSSEYADVILISGGPDGDATLEWVWAYCRCSSHPKLLLVASDVPPEYREEAVIRGASGVLDKAASASVLMKAVTCVARGELWLDRQTTGRVFDRLSRGMIRKRNRHVTGLVAPERGRGAESGSEQPEARKLARHQRLATAK